MSTPTDDIEAIKNALHRASARIGCPPGDNADADLYRELSHAAELVSRLSAHPKEVAPTVEETVDELMEFLEDYIEEGIEEMHDHSSDHGWQYDRGHPNWNATMDDLRTRLTKLLTTP